MQIFWLFLLSITFTTTTKVIDGDTIKTSDEVTIRLIGIDAPESRNAFSKKKAPFGEESKKYLEDMLAGKSIRLEYDVSLKDRYGRTLAYVYLEDGTFVNEKMIRNGYAVLMTVPPNVKYAERFASLQREGRENKRGLWATE